MSTLGLVLVLYNVKEQWSTRFWLWCLKELCARFCLWCTLALFKVYIIRVYKSYMGNSYKLGVIRGSSVICGIVIILLTDLNLKSFLYL